MYKLHELEKPILFSNTERLHYVSFHHFDQDWTKGTEHSDSTAMITGLPST